MKYLLLMLCLSFTVSGNAQSFSDFESYDPQIVLDMDHFPVVKDGVMTIGYNYLYCDDAFKLPVILMVTVCDSGKFEPCTFYSEIIKPDSSMPKQVTWTLNKIPMSLCGTILVNASITTMGGKPLLEPHQMKVFTICYLPKKDSVQVIEK